MTISIIVIIIAMVGAVGFTGLCSFNPGRPENGPVQEVDAKTFMDLEARAMNFPVRFPQMPQGWVTNSARRSIVAGQPAPAVGWVTPQEGYLQLTQTDVEADRAARDFDGNFRDKQRTVDVAGRTATVYFSDDEKIRPLWVVDATDVRLLVTGAGEDAEFTSLIDETLATAPLPH
ncbi:DUF4245 domain-containing protein [Corynebacterium aquatimens]|nr:hypothetical protein CAQUA_07655 [Corynebacterium aquatimens]